MYGEDQTGEPRAGQGQSASDQDEKASSQRMQGDVQKMVADDPIGPEVVFQPEGTVEQRIVLLGGGGVGPDAPEAVEVAEIGAGDVGGVVPEERAVDGGQVCGEGHEDDRRIPAPGSKGGCY